MLVCCGMYHDEASTCMYKIESNGIQQEASTYMYKIESNGIQQEEASTCVQD